MSKTRILPEPIPDEWLKQLHKLRRQVLARKLYFEDQSSRYKRMDQGLKIILALTSSSVAGLAIWDLLFPKNMVTYISTFAV